ncbi:MAG: hypothetical protein DMF17_04200 [Verrucomicrobia bacterium]|nr:MAG: hypothetical protein DMF17_04200 [Verrucomicrobiota bacterium]
MKQRWLIGLVLLASMPAMEAQSFKFLKSIPVGGEGGWDYLSVDAKARKLYVAHATKIVIVDLTSDKVVGEIGDTPGVHGFAIASRLRQTSIADSRVTEKNRK